MLPVYMGGSRGGGGGGGQGVWTPLKNHKNIGFPRILIPIPKNLKATKPAFDGEPLSARQRKAISMAFHGGPMMAHFLSPSHQLKKKRCQCWTPSDKVFWIRACVYDFML